MHIMTQLQPSFIGTWKHSQKKKKKNSFNSFNLKFNPFDNTPSLKVSNNSVLSE